MPTTTERETTTKLGDAGQPASAREIADAIARFRLTEIARNIEDVLAGFDPQNAPFTFNDLRAAVVRETQLDQFEGTSIDDADSNAGYLLGVAVGRRLRGDL